MILTKEQKISSLHYEENKVLICKRNRQRSMVDQNRNQYRGDEAFYIVIHHGLL